jgi:hypothetical protein
MARIHMTCKYKVRRVEIDDELLKEKKQTIESVVAAAYNDAAKKVERKVQEKYSGITGGLPLPQGMKLPF